MNLRIHNLVKESSSNVQMAPLKRAILVPLVAVKRQSVMDMRPTNTPIHMLALTVNYMTTFIRILPLSTITIQRNTMSLKNLNLVKKSPNNVQMELPRDATLVPLVAVRRHSVTDMMPTNTPIPTIGMRMILTANNTLTFIRILQLTTITIQLNTMSLKSLNLAKKSPSNVQMEPPRDATLVP